MHTLQKTLSIGALAICACAGLVILMAYGFVKALDGQDQVQCYQWQQQATQFKGFYLTKDEAAQCAYWKIPVTAPIQ